MAKASEKTISERKEQDQVQSEQISEVKNVETQTIQGEDISETKVPEVEKVSEVNMASDGEQRLVIWKATRPLKKAEHEAISDRLRFEQGKTGVNIILMPYTCELNVD